MSKYDEMWAAQETIDGQAALIRELVHALDELRKAEPFFDDGHPKLELARERAISALSRVPEEYRG